MRGPSLAALPLLAALLLASGVPIVHASAPTSDAAELASLMTAFEHNFQPSDFAMFPYLDAQVALRHAETRGAPSFGISQQLDWPWAGAVDLRLSADAALPLYSGRSTHELAAASTSVAVAALELARERAEARASFLGDLIALRLLSESLSALDTALPAVNRAFPELLDAEEAPAEIRPLIELHAETFGLRQHLALIVGQLRSRIALATGIDELDIAAPTLAELEGALPVAAAGVDACLENAPLAAAALLRYRQAAAADALRDALEVRVVLNVSASYSTASGPGARAVLAANVALPADWPFAGNGGLSLGLDGVSQDLQIRWPPSPPPAPASRSAEEDLARALAGVGRDFRTARAALEQAEYDLALAELRLHWATADAADPAAQLHAADLRARAAFAAASAALARIDLGVLCGWAP